MIVGFESIDPVVVKGMNEGAGEMTARMASSDGFRFVSCSLHPGCSIGMHRHESSVDINFVVSGSGEAVCDGAVEELGSRCVHICPRGSEHSIRNTGDTDLCLLTAVVYFRC